MNRRLFLGTAAATATAAAAKTANAATEGPLGETGVPLRASEGLPLGPLPDSRYPDTHIETLEKRFKARVGTGAVERVATGFHWAEGPALFGRPLSHIQRHSNNRMMRLLEDDDHLSVFRAPSFNSNGNTVDPQGPARHV